MHVIYVILKTITAIIRTGIIISLLFSFICLVTPDFIPNVAIQV